MGELGQLIVQDLVSLQSHQRKSLARQEMLLQLLIEPIWMMSRFDVVSPLNSTLRLVVNQILTRFGGLELLRLNLLQTLASLWNHTRPYSILLLQNENIVEHTP